MASKNREIADSCVICLDSAEGRRTKVLPCSHTACLRCLARLKEAKSGAGNEINEILNCPLCRQPCTEDASRMETKKDPLCFCRREQFASRHHPVSMPHLSTILCSCKTAECGVTPNLAPASTFSERYSKTEPTKEVDDTLFLKGVLKKISQLNARLQTESQVIAVKIHERHVFILNEVNTALKTCLEELAQAKTASMKTIEDDSLLVRSYLTDMEQQEPSKRSLSRSGKTLTDADRRRFKEILQRKEGECFFEHIYGAEIAGTLTSFLRYIMSPVHPVGFNQAENSKCALTKSKVTEESSEHTAAAFEQRPFSQQIADAMCLESEVVGHEQEQNTVTERKQLQDNTGTSSERFQQPSLNLDALKAEQEQNKSVVQISETIVNKLEENFRKLEASVEKVTENVNKLQAKFGTNDANIAANGEKLEAIESKLEKHDKEHEVHRDTLLACEGKLKAHEEKLKAHEEKLKTNEEKLEIYEEKLKTNEEKLEIYEEKLKEREEKQKAIEEKLDEQDRTLEANNAKLEAHEGTLKVHEEKLKADKHYLEKNDANDAQVEVHEEKPRERQEKLEAHEEFRESYDARLHHGKNDTLAGNDTELERLHRMLEVNSELRSSVDNCGSRMEKLGKHLDELEAGVDRLQAQVGKLEANDQKMKSYVQNLEANIQDHDTKFEARVENIDADVQYLLANNNLDERFKKLQTFVEEGRRHQDILERKQTQLCRTFEGFSNAQENIECINEELRKERATIMELENKLRKLSVQVAFHSQLGEVFTTRHPQTLVCDMTVVNIGGGYDCKTGVFTAPVPGLYCFLTTSSPFQDDTSKKATLNIILEGKAVAYLSASGKAKCTAHTSVQLKAGQKVWLRSVGDECIFYGGCTVFTGMLITAEI